MKRVALNHLHLNKNFRIGSYSVWQSSNTPFCIHPSGATRPTNKKSFKNMFQAEVNDANTASVVSGALGIPIGVLNAGQKTVAGITITVNQSQLDRQVPNLRDLVQRIE